MKNLLLILLFIFPINSLSETNNNKTFMSDYALDIELHSLGFQSRDNEKNLDFSINLESINNDNEMLSVTLDNEFLQSTDSFEKISTETNATNLEINYEINKLWGNFGFDSYMTYSNERENEVFLTKHDLELAPAGIKYLAYEKGSTLFSISYHPTYNFFEAEDSDKDSSGNVTYSSYKETSLLHLVHFNFQSIAFDHVQTNVSLYWKKFDPLTVENALKREDVTSIAINLSHQLNNYLSFGYKYRVDKNNLRKTFQELSAENEKHSFYLKFLLN